MWLICLYSWPAQGCLLVLTSRIFQVLDAFEQELSGLLKLILTCQPALNG